MDTYEYSSGPSIFMSGESDWIIRRVGKPGIVASVIGHESHAKQAVHALNQVAKHSAFTDQHLRDSADRLAAALNIAIYGAHQAYGSTATHHGGIGGQAITSGCDFNDPAPGRDYIHAGYLSLPLRDYTQRYGPLPLRELTQALTEELKAQWAEANKPPQEGK